MNNLEYTIQGFLLYLCDPEDDNDKGVLTAYNVLSNRQKIKNPSARVKELFSSYATSLRLSGSERETLREAVFVSK